MLKLLIIIFVTKTLAEPMDSYEIREIINNGIYFEKYARAALYEETYNIFTTIKIPKFNEEINEIISIHQTMNNLCQNIRLVVDHQCQILTKKTKHEIEEMIHNNFFINHSRRNKRALANIIGSASKYLFGTMDDDDATHISSELRELHSNIKEEATLINEQTAIIPSNFHTLTKANEETTIEQNIIKSRLENLANQTKTCLKNIADTTELTRLSEQFSELTSTLIISCSKIIRTQLKLISIFNSLRRNHLHPLLLTPNDITRALNKKPDQNYDRAILNANTASKLARTESLFDNDRVIIKVCIPIPHISKYNAYKIFLIPFQTNNATMILNINEDVILSNEEKTKFITSTTYDMDHCQQIDENENIIICKNIKPTLTINNENCAIRLLANPFNKTINCKTTEIVSRNTMTRMNKPNTWLYSTRYQITLILKEEHKSSLIHLRNNGIITIKQKGEILTEDTILPIEISSKTEIVQSEETFNLGQTTILSKVNFDNNPDQKIDNIKFLDHNTHNKNFEKENTKIEKLTKHSSDLLTNLQTIKYQSIHPHSIANTVAISIIIIIIIATTVLLIKCHKRATKTLVEKIINLIT